MEEMIDEWKAADLLLGLAEIYSNLSPVWIRAFEIKEETDSFTAEELEDKLTDLIGTTPEPLRRKLKEVRRNLRDIYLGSDKKNEVILQDSEIGKEIFAMMEEACDYLKNSWRKLYCMEERVLEIFPPVHFDFRSQISDLNREHFHHSILDSLEKAISFFDKKEYLDCINYCNNTSEKLTETLIKHCGLTCERNWRSNIDKLRSNHIKRKISLINLYWLVLYLLDVIYFMRNPHPTRAIDIPEWMDNYQKHMRENQPRWARIALVCSLEAAEVFQEIVEHS